MTTWHDASPPLGSEIAPIRDTRDEDSAGRSGMVSCFDCNYSTVALCLGAVLCRITARYPGRGRIGPGWISARPVSSGGLNCVPGYTTMILCYGRYVDRACFLGHTSPKNDKGKRMRGIGR